MRNLTKTLAVVSLLAPASAHPLGIGEIKLRSALNQNLNAEIAFVLSAGENISDIKVNLASPDKFEEAGVPWASFLSKIRFQIDGNNKVIRLSSREALKEPFLDFLIEVSWPKGNLYREFTVLADPPAVYKQAALPLLTRPESYRSGPEEVAPQSESRMQLSAQPVVNAAIDTYGPVRKNDTLWKVAEQTRGQDDVSVEQMMIAIYEENPRAFFQDNVNALMAGKVLKLPEKEVILKLSRKQALAEFNRQTKAWTNHLAPAAVETATAKEASVNNQLTLAAPRESTVAENAVVAPPVNEQTAAEKKPADALPSGSGAGKSVEAGNLVNESLQSKVAELEKQLAVMQQTLALKEQQLTALQNRPQAMTSIQEQPLAANPGVEEKAVQPDPDEAKVISPAVQPKPAPVAQPQIHPESETDAYYLGMGGLGAALLSLLGWLWWRKRKVDEATDTESMFASSIIKKPEVRENFSVPVIEAGSAYNVADAIDEHSFLNEFVANDLDKFDTAQGEIDPVSEADVYLAYGRYQQAEELIRHAIKDQPERDECKLKLLEIFYSSENKKAFETYAHELAEAGKKSDIEFWSKVTNMGSGICPDSPLFSFGENTPLGKNDLAINNNYAGLTKIKADKESKNFDEVSFEGSLIDDVQKPTAKAIDSVQDVYSTSLPAENNSDFDEQKNNQAIDFDLSSFATDTKKPDPIQDKIDIDKVDINEEFGSFDFDFDLKEPEAKKAGEMDVGALKSFDISDEEIDFSIAKTSGSHAASDKNSFGNEYDFNFDLDMSSADSNDQSANQKSSFGVSDLTDMDEMETKLDLARAYIDMGDTDAAKDIAEEVLKKGTNEQKEAAQTLLQM
ncbi:FimV [Candidatus Methylobacter favarea]|uniref:FimV n=1 Tax=Candidatus Methylobacter favarea TaxID=2707345 RepID=A0A8S0WMJ3_9GAMM|nr:FimV/HubP family polar landmark protein [Candidatus Methylobacter favarea]CAA9889800.1 FimV [Candidatus Methylobacter favarea]